MRTNRALLRFALCASAGMCSTIALAQTEDSAYIPALEADATPSAESAARALFERGNDAFNVGQFAQAAEHFRGAYELSNHADFLFNIYSALEREGGHLEEASDALEQYLELGNVPEDRHAPLNARLQRMKARVAEQQAAAANAALANAGTEERRESRGVHPAATALLITGGAFLVSFGVFAALSSSEDSSLDDSCGTACNDDEVSTLRTYNLIADISWITGLAAAATGVVLLFALKPGDDDESATRLSPWMAPNAGGATLRGSF